MGRIVSFREEVIEHDIADVLTRSAPLSRAIKPIAPSLTMLPVVVIGGTVM
jgi:hypothetical protein